MDRLFTLLIGGLLFLIVLGAAGPGWGSGIVALVIAWLLRRHIYDALTRASREAKVRHPRSAAHTASDPRAGQPLDLPVPANEQDAIAQEILQLRHRLAYLRRPGLGRHIYTVDGVEIYEFAILYQEDLVSLDGVSAEVGVMLGVSTYAPRGAEVRKDDTRITLRTPSGMRFLSIDTSFHAYVNHPVRGWTNGHDVGAVDRHSSGKKMLYKDLTENRRIGYLDRKENWRWQRQIDAADLKVLVRIIAEQSAATTAFIARRPTEYADVRARLAQAKSRLQALVAGA